MDKEQLFVVDLRGFEPHTFHTGSGYTKVKRELREAILSKLGQIIIQESRSKISNNPIKVEIRFRLWKGSKEITRTRSEKDLDNLLKPVLDVLQTHSDQQKTNPGIDLIENDKLIYEINAKKELVDDAKEEGVEIVILPYP